MAPGLRKLLAITGVVALIFALVLTVAGADRRRELCLATGLCAQPDFLGAMLVSVQRQSRHIVLTARLVAPITSGRDTTLGPVTIATTRQTAIVPATVHYAVDFSRMQPSDLSWDADTQTLKVRRPPVQPMEAAIEWEKADIYGDAGLITAVTEVRQRLEADNRAKAPAVFRAQARATDLMRLADEAADDAIRSLFLMPLLAAGHSDAKVIVSR